MANVVVMLVFRLDFTENVGLVADFYVCIRSTRFKITTIVFAIKTAHFL
jgi:hypothetical protein